MRKSKQTSKQKKNKKRKQTQRELKRNREYPKEFDDICKKIKLYIPHISVEFRKSSTTGLLELIFVKEQSVMSVTNDNTWDEITRHIDSCLKEDKGLNCQICQESIINRTGCTKCSADWCVECYINIFKTGRGIIKCPFCRYTPEICRIMTDEELLLGEIQIRDKLHKT